MYQIFKRELSAYLSSLIAYIVIVLFLILTGLVLWVFPDSNILDYGYADMGSFFSLTPFVLMIIVPAIAMRSFSEEFKSGTIELLFTKPLSDFDIIMGKFFAAWALIIMAIIPTVFYYFSIRQIGNPIGNLDTGAIIGSYLGLTLLAGVFTAIGIFCSSLTNNQVIAFILSAFACYFFYDGMHQIAALFKGQFAFVLDYISLQFHYDALGRGLIDTRNLIYLCSFSVLLYLCCQKALNWRRQ